MFADSRSSTPQSNVRAILSAPSVGGPHVWPSFSVTASAVSPVSDSFGAATLVQPCGYEPWSLHQISGDQRVR
jgi:hypothetical protein